MPGRLFEQGQNDQLELAGAQLAPNKEATATEPSAIAEDGPESANVAPVGAPRAAVVPKPAMHWDLRRVTENSS
jgi:hypothetical protein